MWCLYVVCSKHHGGARIISSLGGLHICTHPIINVGHRKCNSKFISHFIPLCIRQQINLKPRKIIG